MCPHKPTRMRDSHFSEIYTSLKKNMVDILCQSNILKLAKSFMLYCKNSKNKSKMTCSHASDPIKRIIFLTVIAFTNNKALRRAHILIKWHEKSYTLNILWKKSNSSVQIQT